MEMDFTAILDKPYLIGTYNWDTTKLTNDLIFKIKIPEDLLVNFMAGAPFNYSTYMQGKVCLMMQVSGTPMHQGTLIAASIPVNSPRVDHINQILSAPHVFLQANEATPVCLECPMYIPGTLYRTWYDDIVIGSDEQDLNFCEVRVKVLNPLLAAAGSTQQLTISVHAIFKEAHFYIPKNGAAMWTGESTSIPTTILDSLTTGLKRVTGDIIDIGRQAIRELTGFHNPNVPYLTHAVMRNMNNRTNAVDIPTFVENMYNHSLHNRIYDDYYFRTDTDEMSIKHLTSKPVFHDTLKISDTDTKGTLLMSYPITPFVEVHAGVALMNPNYYSPLRTIYENSTHWRGGMKMQLQSSCSNFHYFKIMVVKMYGNSSPIVSQFRMVPQLEGLENLITETIEFNAGGQIHEIDLPYASNYNQLPCTLDLGENAVQHGTVFIYLLQPLVKNSNVSSTVSLNVYFRGGDDLTFSGLAIANATVPADLTTESFFMAESAETNVEASGQEPILITKNDDLQRNYASAFQPNVSIRDYLRRFIQIERFVSGENASVHTIEVNRALRAASSNGFSSLATLFYGLSGGLKFKVKIEGVKGSSIHFAPPSNLVGTDLYYMVPSRDDTGGTVNTEILSNMIYGYYPTPTIEIPQAVVNETHGSTVEYEFSIPNLNKCNFVGSTSNYRNTRSPDASLGVIFINLVKNSPSDNVVVTIFCALNDEARLGLQVYNPVKTVPQIAIDGVMYRKTPIMTTDATWQTLGFSKSIVMAMPMRTSYYSKLV